MKTLLAEIEYEGFTVTTYSEPEFDSYRSLNSFCEPEDINEIEAKIDSGEYEHFFVTVQASKMGIVLGEAQLGSNVYANPSDFVKELHGYNEDLIEQAVTEAKENLRLLINEVQS